MKCTDCLMVLHYMSYDLRWSRYGIVDGFNHRTLTVVWAFNFGMDIAWAHNWYTPKRKCVGIKSKLTELILCNFQMKSSMCHAHPTRSSDASYKILQAQLEGIDGGSDEQWTWLAGVVPSRDAGTRSPAMCGLQLDLLSGGDANWRDFPNATKCN